QASVGRNVTGGQDVFLGDRIVTGPGGGLQILLLDGTTFSIGPNTSMVIDEFVYNPATGVGKLTASVARGTLRVISGRLARQEQEAIRIRLPMATVGVRGTMVVLSGGPNGFFIGLFGIGANNSADRPQSMVFVYNNGGGNGIYRAGFGCTVTAASPVCHPQPVGPEFLQNLLGQIGGQLRYVSLEEFERVTGLDWVEALKRMGKPGGFEDLWQTINTVFQAQNRPGNLPPPPTCNYCD
ncbi:MAG TPA: FecR domain-containing protein, partial [Alphaproteobacteria bacterium]